MENNELLSESTQVIMANISAAEHLIAQGSASFKPVVCVVTCYSFISEIHFILKQKTMAMTNNFEIRFTSRSSKSAV